MRKAPPAALLTLALVACGQPTPPAAVSNPSTGAAIHVLSFKSTQAFSATSSATGDELGEAVAVSGNTILVGAPNDDRQQLDAGAAHLYERGADQVWTEQRLVPQDPKPQGGFGDAVAISGDVAVVGAPRYSGSFSTARAGAAYLFQRGADGQWTQVARLTAPALHSNALFGTAVAVRDGTVLVGAVGDNGQDANGSVYVFQAVNGTWTQTAELKAGDGQPGELFGSALDVSGDTVVIGAAGRTAAAGAAYVFRRSNGAWGQGARLTAPAGDDQTGDSFGSAVAIRGDTLAVGAERDDAGGVDAGAAYVFSRTNGAWSLVNKVTATGTAAGDLFGGAVSLGGGNLVVGARASGGQGAAFVFHPTGTTWSEVARLPAPTPEIGVAFGRSVALEGNTVVVGAPLADGGAVDAGAAYAFTNAVPTAPGAPALKAPATSPLNATAFSLGWSASTDPDSDPLTYVLEHKNAAQNYSTVAAGLTSTAYGFVSSVLEPEGTWTYRVQVKDLLGASAVSAESSAVKVDRTAPTAPTATVSGTKVGDWYKDGATVTYGGGSDPRLPDGSDGSGVVSTTAAQSTQQSGVFTYSGTATDGAGNVSPAATGSVKVDATPPAVTLACPTASVLLKSARTITWGASDAHSGLASAPSGSVTLDTGTVGQKTVNVTATDNVGHTTTGTCTYQVAYDFQGFLQPVDNLPVVNTVKSGSSIPVKFSLRGNQGLNIMATGYPRTVAVSCVSGAPTDEIETTTTNVGTTYDAATDTYTYVWKTTAGTVGCFRLEVRLNDGTDHNALFQLR